MRSKLKHLRKAERLRAGRKMRAKRRSQFVKNPYKFTKTLLIMKAQDGYRAARRRLRSISATPTVTQSDRHHWRNVLDWKMFLHQSLLSTFKSQHGKRYRR